MIRVKLREVTSCGGCPLAAPRLDENAVARGLTCNLTADAVGARIPITCPLRTADVLVRIRKPKPGEN